MPTTATSQPMELAKEQQQSTATNRLEEKRGSTQSSLSSGNSQDGDLSLLSSNAADYDHIRNTTLMFFLDRLYIASKDGKEARTLHDLSCLFGTKDFTKEMRQIVGASRNGLRKFLQSYPSLFTIEGDKVYLTQLRADSGQSSRDYNKEAVEYFTQKLNQFGASLVPIRNLFGYRSQASQEVRHVSGKNTREFKLFLKCHEDVFEILADEHVILKTALRELEARGEIQTAISKTLQDNCQDDVSMDPYLNKQFAHLIEESLKKMLEESNNNNNEDTADENEASNVDVGKNRVTLECLHEKILQDCKNPLFLKMVKTIDDLKVFLRMHPKIFKRFKSSEHEVHDDETNDQQQDLSGTSESPGDSNECNKKQRDYVTLLSEKERKEFELQAYPSSFIISGNINQKAAVSCPQSTLERSETIGSNVSELSQQSQQQPVSLPPLHQLTTKAPEKGAPEFETTTTTTSADNSQAPAGKSSNLSPASKRDQHNQSNPRRPLANSSSSSSLRANAPPFVPTMAQPTRGQLQTTMSNVQSKPAAPLVGPNRQSMPHQIKRSSSSLTNPSRSSAQPQRSVIDPRQALRAHLIKASVENSANGLYSPSKQSNGAQYQDQRLHLHQSQPQAPAGKHHQPLAQQMSNGDDLRARTVNIVREASNIIARIMTTTDEVAFDCKGYNLGFNGQITLIQFGYIPKTQELEASSVARATQGSIYAPAAKPIPSDKSAKPEVRIFDLITNPELAYCLKPLLESDKIVKIVHDVRNKSNALHAQFGIMLRHVFDTQVANLVIQQQETGKPAYKSRYISMSKLCEVYGDETLMKHRNLIKSKTRHSGGGANNSNSVNRVKDVNYWKTRPLNDAMICESTLDVYCLVKGIYQNLKSKIKPEYQPLFEQLNLEGVLARIKPDEIRSVKKERKIDLEVIELKRKLYSGSTSSIVLSNREIRLLRHIDLTDEVRQKIQHCKKVAKKLERLDMKAAQAQASQSLPPNSHSSSDTETNNEHPSMDPTSINSHESSSTNNSLCQNDESSLTKSLDPSNIEMSNLMDDSMFDELKDTMIESSSLLKSLEDEDDDEELNNEHHHHSHESHHSGSDCCRCQCHGGSTDGEKDKTSLSVKSVHSQHSATSDKDDAGSTGSRAVDMAIQCDLLS